MAVLVLMFVTVALRDGTGHPTHPGTPLLVFTLPGWLPLTVRFTWPVAGRLVGRGDSLLSPVATTAVDERFLSQA